MLERTFGGHVAQILLKAELTPRSVKHCSTKMIYDTSVAVTFQLEKMLSCIKSLNSVVIQKLMA